MLRPGSKGFRLGLSLSGLAGSQDEKPRTSSTPGWLSNTSGTDLPAAAVTLPTPHQSIPSGQDLQSEVLRTVARMKLKEMLAPVPEDHRNS